MRLPDRRDGNSSGGKKRRDKQKNRFTEKRRPGTRRQGASGMAEQAKGKGSEKH